jgi:hypothetical protein
MMQRANAFRAYRMDGAYARQPACRTAVHLSGLPQAERTARERYSQYGFSALRRAHGRQPNWRFNPPCCVCAERAVHSGVGLWECVDRRGSLLGDTGGFHHAFAAGEDYAYALCRVCGVGRLSLSVRGRHAGSNIFYNDGNVGIGTSSPAARLSLGGGEANTKLAIWQGATPPAR